MDQGVGVSKGVGIGRVVKIQEVELTYAVPLEVDTEMELIRFHSAVKTLIASTTVLAEKLKQRVGDAQAKIVQGQISIITDPTLTKEIEVRIKNHEVVEAAVTKVCNQYIAMFSIIEDELMRQRSTDIEDIKVRLLKLLLGIEEIELQELPMNSVLVVHELTPTMILELKKENVKGIITEVGSETSHSAILARSLEIPAVFGVVGSLERLKDYETVIVDGFLGLLITNPTDDQINIYQEKARHYQEETALLLQYSDKKTVTLEGLEKVLLGNIGNLEEVGRVIEYGGEGIGLFRTEFLFMGRASLPSEEEQFKAYQSVLTAMKGKSVVIRTLDIGGDKDIPYLGLSKEENPSLGYRAIRYCLDHELLFKTQLRALLRASVYGKLKILLPLITSVEEIQKVKILIKKCQEELTAESIQYATSIPIGIMMETPAASQIADLLAKEADFFSIGTNDLTQYTMVADRGNTKVAYLYQTLHPAVLRSIQHIIDCAKKENIKVSMCGEAASDSRLIPLLLSFGLDEFSVAPASLLETKKAIATTSLSEAQGLMVRVMKASTLLEVLQIVDREEVE